MSLPAFPPPGQDEPDDVLEAKALAERLGIEHHVADVREGVQTDYCKTLHR